MEPISSQPQIKLSRLRDIGWKLWDPICLLAPGGPFAGRWDDDDNISFADEYDSHLVAAASQLRRGACREQVVNYFIEIEINNMALRENSTTRERAAAVVDAILSDDEIWTWPDENGNFA
ncbi:hypothetical protein [Roseovarius sp. 2305UL8-3]|uniref:hypothetical protein n=1 Tax=Roseovarius conchicola TaxID=3121636 RepID=UPI003529479B